jgi:hypothetical protein
MVQFKPANREEAIRARLEKLDYIGTKIAMGRATREQYAAEIAEADALAAELDEIEAGKAAGNNRKVGE